MTVTKEKSEAIVAGAPQATQLAEVDPAIRGLYASRPQPLPFAPSTETRAFVLEREQGNLLVYSVDGLAGAGPALTALGGVSRHYLNHRHEAMFARDPIAAPLFTHRDERSAVARSLPVRATFSRRHLLDRDFEVIPTPGHTSGATAFLWHNGERRLLFTGDTISLRDEDWLAAVLDSSDRAAYVESLELIRELEFDVLVPWAATSGGPYHAITTPADARRRIDAILARVRRGEDR